MKARSAVNRVAVGVMGLAALGVLGSPVDATVYPCIERAEKVGEVVEYRTYCPPSTSAPSTTSTTPATTTTLVTTTTTAPAPAPSTTTTVAPVVKNLTVDREDDAPERAKVAVAIVAKPGLTG